MKRERGGKDCGLIRTQSRRGNGGGEDSSTRTGSIFLFYTVAIHSDATSGTYACNSLIFHDTKCHFLHRAFLLNN